MTYTLHHPLYNYAFTLRQFFFEIVHIFMSNFKRRKMINGTKPLKPLTKNVKAFLKALKL